MQRYALSGTIQPTKTKEVPLMWFTVLSLAVIGGAMCINR